MSRLLQFCQFQVSEVQGLFKQENPDEAAAGDKAADGADAAAPTTMSTSRLAGEILLQAKEQLDSLLSQLELAFGVSGAMREEEALVSTTQELQEVLRRDSGAAAEVGEDGQVELVKLLEGWEGSRLLRLVLSLEPAERKQIADAVQRVAIDLVGQGVDMEAMSSNADYRGPHAGASSATGKTAARSSLAPLPKDVFGFRPVPEDVLERLARGVGKLEGQLGKLQELAGGPPVAGVWGTGIWPLFIVYRHNYPSFNSPYTAVPALSGFGPRLCLRLS